jgi:phosphoribosylformimino-5-aminoimidazole carboxamide ribotide isomerase
MLQGTSVELYREILASFPDLYLIASGGVGSMQDILDLEAAHVPAVILGKAIYENKVKPNELTALSRRVGGAFAN